MKCGQEWHRFCLKIVKTFEAPEMNIVVVIILKTSDELFFE